MLKINYRRLHAEIEFRMIKKTFLLVLVMVMDSSGVVKYLGQDQQQLFPFTLL